MQSSFFLIQFVLITVWSQLLKEHLHNNVSLSLTNQTNISSLSGLLNRSTFIFLTFSIFLQIANSSSSDQHSLSSFAKSPFLHQPQNLLCKHRPVNWANASSGRIEFVYKHELAEIFSNSAQGSSRLWSHSNFIKRFVAMKTSYPLQKMSYDCIIFFIYSTKCRFSYASLPYINALARAYPQFRIIGVQVQDYLAYKWSLRMLYLPKTKLLVDGKIFQEYTGSDVHLDDMIDFVWTHFHEVPIGPVGLRPSDYENNPFFEHTSFNICLAVSWIVTCLGFVYLLILWQTSIFSRISNM